MSVVKIEKEPDLGYLQNTYRIVRLKDGQTLSMCLTLNEAIEHCKKYGHELEDTMSVPEHLLEPVEIDCPNAKCENGKVWVMVEDEGQWEPCPEVNHMTESEQHEHWYQHYRAR